MQLRQQHKFQIQDLSVEISIGLSSCPLPFHVPLNLNCKTKAANEGLWVPGETFEVGLADFAPIKQHQHEAMI